MPEGAPPEKGEGQVNLALQQQQIQISETSWVGHTTMAGFGVILLVISFLSIKGRKRKDGSRTGMFLWGPMFGALMNKLVTQPTQRMAQKWGGGDEGLDWKSLMTFLVGMWAVTSILSSAPGTLLNLAEWFQSLITMMSGWPILADIGAGGLCFFLIFLAMRNKDDDKSDLAYGALCGLIFPLGGGSFAEITLAIGNWIPEVMNLG